jgi:hypothetical protein
MRVIDKLELTSIDWYDVQIGTNVYDVKVLSDDDIRIYHLINSSDEIKNEVLRQEIIVFIKDYITMEKLIK